MTNTATPSGTLAMGSRAIIVGLLIWPALWISLSARANDCAQDVSRAQAADAAQDLEGLLAVAKRMARSGCPVANTQTVKDMATDLASNQAQTLIAQSDLNAAADRLALAPSTTWRREVGYGDLYAHRKQWDKAAVRYNRAYTLMLAQGQASSRPQQAEIDRVAALAGQAVVLADDLSAVVSRGSGRGQGIYSKGHRVVPAPVRFETDSARLTPQGEQQASMLARYLKTREGDGATVTLIGHADERGDPQYNLQLSARRAETLKDYLAQQGVTLTLRTQGVGMQQPYALPPGGAPLSNEERWALDRRVELHFD